MAAGSGTGVVLLERQSPAASQADSKNQPSTTAAAWGPACRYRSAKCGRMTVKAITASLCCCFHEELSQSVP